MAEKGVSVLSKEPKQYKHGIMVLGLSFGASACGHSATSRYSACLEIQLNKK